MVNRARREADQAAAELVRQPADGDRNARAGASVAAPGRARVGPRLLERGEIAGDVPRTVARAGARPPGRARPPTSSAAGADSQKAPGAAAARRAASAGVKRGGGERDHAYARASASAAARKLRMYCAMENSDTAVET